MSGAPSHEAAGEQGIVTGGIDRENKEDDLIGLSQSEIIVSDSKREGLALLLYQISLILDISSNFHVLRCEKRANRE